MDNNRDMNITGKIKLINDTKVVGNGFRKRDFVVETNDKYPQSILVEMTQDNCDSLDRFNKGDDVKVSINIRGREWTSPQGEVKYFNTIQGWKIDNNVAEVTTADHSPDRDSDLPF